MEIGKKILGIPIFMLVILFVGVVIAGGLYYFFFSKDILVQGHINHPKVPTQFVITGDLDPDLDCFVGELCHTGNISIYNPTNFTQSVLLDVTTRAGMMKRIIFFNIDNSPPDQPPNSVGYSYLTNIQSKQTLTFWVGLVLNPTDDNDFNATISVKSNMTQEYV